VVRRLGGVLGRRRERGAVAVEFALVLPILLLLVLGGIDWGYFFFAGEVAANAAREAARTGSIARVRMGYTDPCQNDPGPPTAPGAIAVATSYLQGAGLITGPMDGRLKTIEATCPSAMGNSCCQLTNVIIGGTSVPVIRVTLAYQVRPGSMSLTGFLPAALLPIAAVATATMRMEP
jgi:hypothetical protein